MNVLLNKQGLVELLYGKLRTASADQSQSLPLTMSGASPRSTDPLTGTSLVSYSRRASLPPPSALRVPQRVLRVRQNVLPLIFREDISQSFNPLGNLNDFEKEENDFAFCLIIFVLF